MKGGKKFEVLVDPEKALEVKGGKDVPIDDLMAVRDVFEDSKKGEHVSPDVLNKTFGTNDSRIIAIKIIREGDLQLTTEQRNRMLEEKKKAVAMLISKQGVNPQTGAPHPQDRVLRAMDEAKARVVLEKRAEEQVDEIVKAIQKIMPISFEKVQVGVRIPAEFSGKGSAVVRNFGTPSREEWASDGGYMCTMELAASAQVDLFDRLNSLTHGNVQVKIIKK